MNTFQEMDKANKILTVQRVLAAGDAFHNMGFITLKHVQTMYELDVVQVIYEDDYHDCPCCADYMDEDYYLALLTGYDDNFVDAYEKSNREKARDRFRRNTSKRSTFAMRGYKSRGRTFKRG